MSGRPGAVPSRKDWPQLQVRVSPETKARLLDAADERVIGVSLLVERLLAEGLARLVPVDELTGGERELVSLREDHPGLLEELRSRGLRGTGLVPQQWYWVLDPADARAAHLAWTGARETACGLDRFNALPGSAVGPGDREVCLRCAEVTKYRPVGSGG